MPVRPKPLPEGGTIGVVAPASPFDERSQIDRGVRWWESKGYRVKLGEHVAARDDYVAGDPRDRARDVEAMFADPEVDVVQCLTGGFGSMQLVPHLDFELVAEHPKAFCGYSDITALQNAVLARTGLVTYSGPHFSTFGMLHGLEYTLGFFERCLMREEPFAVPPADHWSDDHWYQDQEDRDLVPNSGYETIHEGEAEGRLLGGNLGTLSLLFGTSFMPYLEGSVLLLEDDEEIQPVHFDRLLQFLIHQPDFEGVSGIVLGRFQRASGMDLDTLEAIVESKPELARVPVVANASFGHTTPGFTFPLGGYGRLRAAGGAVELFVDVH